eukprot:TRINITY_DN1070_c0_g1_i1.p1 TRINITY_DN1070_c0_g1~~TRINITY_DN1070_c0_g1_i1.p1  ORF type:complete len:87 (-),score=17.84 TRINITY_DN1070_c0_g1_i1:120-341(-)
MPNVPYTTSFQIEGQTDSLVNPILHGLLLAKKRTTKNVDSMILENDGDRSASSRSSFSPSARAIASASFSETL